MTGSRNSHYDDVPGNGRRGSRPSTPENSRFRDAWRVGFHPDRKRPCQDYNCWTGKIAVAASILSLLALLQACITTQSEMPTSTVRIYLLPGDRISVKKKIVDIADITGELKSRGIGTNTGIIVAIRKDTPRATMSSIISALSVSGYQKIIFARPKEAASYASERGGWKSIVRPRIPEHSETF